MDRVLAHLLVNIKTGAKYDVYIGRPTEWGNPFVIGRDGTREQVIRLYDQWLMKERHDLLRNLSKLRGKVLGCYCAPELCHGDVLVKYANLPQSDSSQPGPSLFVERRHVHGHAVGGHECWGCSEPIGVLHKETCQYHVSRLEVTQ